MMLAEAAAMSRRARFMGCVPSHAARQSTSMPRSRSVVVKRLILLAVLLAGVICVFVRRDYFTVPQIQSLVARMGPWGPAVFVLLYSIGPAFLVPGLPFDLAAGVLFGPLWGTVYALIGSTIGATVAFLAARTVGREWTEERLSGLLRKMKDGVDRGGWEFVAFARLVPVIPFNLLNYALASLIFMAPATAVYVYAGWAGGEALAGEGPLGETAWRVGIALTALACLAVLPRLVVRFTRSQRKLPG